MAQDAFHVVLSGDFRRPDGGPSFPDFDLAPLENHPRVVCRFLDAGDDIGPDQVADADALILLVPRVGRNSFHRNGRLSLVARFGVGYDNVDVDACTEHGVALAITPDGVRRPVAVAILTLMLALAGKLLIKDRLTREGPAGFAKKSQHMGVGLTGKTLGSIGIGNIGAEMFRLAKPLDMDFIAHDPYADPAMVRFLGVRLVDLETLFRSSDVLAVNCPLTPATRHLVNAERLGLMKPTAYLINTARGAIVDQKALTKALQKRRLAGAGLDVLEQEPPDADDPLLRLDNVVLAPHALCWTDQCFAGIGASDVKAVLDVMHGREPTGVVNRAVLATEAWRKRLDGYRARFGA
ncbi:MAG: NAD(P)-dependent oxidoreductase [Dongiaceae bacterium]